VPTKRNGECQSISQVFAKLPHAHQNKCRVITKTPGPTKRNAANTLNSQVATKMADANQMKRQVHTKTPGGLKNTTCTPKLVPSANHNKCQVATKGNVTWPARRQVATKRNASCLAR